MSKTKDAATAQPTATPQVLTAKTREELFSKVEELKATLTEGQTLTAGAVGRNDQGLYTIQVDII